LNVVIDSNVLVAMATTPHARQRCGPSSRSGRTLGIRCTPRRCCAMRSQTLWLAQELETDVWTLDGPLSRNAEQTDLPVKLLSAA